MENGGELGVGKDESKSLEEDRENMLFLVAQSNLIILYCINATYLLRSSCSSLSPSCARTRSSQRNPTTQPNPSN